MVCGSGPEWFLVSESQCQDSRRLLRVAVSLCFGLQRELSIERLQMSKKAHRFLCMMGEGRLGEGEEGDESYHDASLYCSVSSTSWSIVSNLKTTVIKTNTQVWSWYINVPLEEERCCIYCLLLHLSLPGRLLFPHHFVGGLTQWLGVF